MKFTQVTYEFISTDHWNVSDNSDIGVEISHTFPGETKNRSNIKCKRKIHRKMCKILFYSHKSVCKLEIPQFSASGNS